MRSRILITSAVALVLVLGGFVAARLLQGPDTVLAEAVGLAPEGTQRYTFTDWAAVREELGTGSSEDDLTALLDAGFDADLTPASGLVESAPLLSAQFGFSPATIAWELLAQTPEGAVEIVSLGDVDPSSVTDRLAALGFQAPAEADGVWVGGTELIATLAGRTGLVATPTLQFVAVDAEAGLLRASDQQPFLEAVLEDDGAEVPDGVEQVVSSLSQSPAAAVVYTGDRACESLAMGQADESDQAVADDLVARAGELNPVTGFAMAVLPGGAVEVLLGFENDDQARTNADTRAALAAGPAPGQGGDFTDRFAVGEVSAEGSVVRLSLEPVDGAYVLSDLSSGPVLFASC